MMRPNCGLRQLTTFLSLAGFLLAPVLAALAGSHPNIIVILADDLGYGELGCYGQTVILTPRLDQMAREGMRFTQFYAGATVCAPSRSVLMTGQHGGHTRVRGNAGTANPLAQSLRPEDVTVAEVLHKAGYGTALIGKWGLGNVGGAEVGLPRRQGFDFFYGYLSQIHAHNHYPSFLWRNESKEPLPNAVAPVGTEGAGYATNAVAYAGDLLTEEALQWIAQPRQQPFFLYWCPVAPHANNERKAALHNGAEVPDLGPYANRPWSDPNKGHAAMITRLDAQVGRLLDELRRRHLDRNTLVLFTSDNGPHRESNHDPDELFHPSGSVRGYKRDLTDGGIRVPLIAWWPGTVRAGRVVNQVAYFGDLMATAADLAGTQPPAGLDSISLVPTLTGRPRNQRQHDYLYWEFHESGFSQAVLIDQRWKAIRLKTVDAPIQLYDLPTD
ncbi:MAG TPA: N-acetylgalactosamine-6-sulfatase, partial [Verrucomicrobiales bacterium]|nr:N-acetylgalactosamine-6-sulfatase [Verrucomicrobiales bacterium]